MEVPLCLPKKLYLFELKHPTDNGMENVFRDGVGGVSVDDFRDKDC